VTCVSLFQSDWTLLVADMVVIFARLGEDPEKFYEMQKLAA